jgi:hypothetical protein
VGSAASNPVTVRTLKNAKIAEIASAIAISNISMCLTDDMGLISGNPTPIWAAFENYIQVIF